ncbi:oxidoreductase [Actinomycetospora chiangmaiensis]|uniref:oxidoreductase n=1 Tax=Actinomycetospora chiangmaiensis TaxID=402650 RepID=UPI000363E257|nr:oxidoreductase [Actinomycetospora chiangmaiensis]
MTDYTARGLDAYDGRTVVITGGSSGIGRATAQALAAAGARVVLGVRDPAKGERVAASLPGTVEVRRLDLADLASVRAFAASWDGPVDALVNNAGVSEPSLRRTVDGFEMDFGVNHLGHFALTELMLGSVVGRVVTVSSQAERGARLDLDDPNWERRPYRSGRAYNDSKFANLLFTAELQRRLVATGSAVRAIAVHPGLVATPIYDLAPGARPTVFHRLLPRLGQDADAGALPTLYALTEDVPGDSFVGPQHMMHMRGGAQVIGRSRAARDADVARRLWDLSAELVHG